MILKRKIRPYLIILIFLCIFTASFTFMRLKNSEVTDAVSYAKFDPGNIMSDYVMSNYTSMTEAEIQQFLTSKISCNNTDYSLYQQLSQKAGYTWHWKDGHFVCLSEELFGDGEIIGSGETAAHIIWQAAQDYRINPQVLLVLIKKESKLFVDNIPNNINYRTATGYGCPDTAPCSAEYYGFKNQVRKAAGLFRTVLDGGWTNYPLGDNYIQYHPNTSCGGTIVNVKNLATSALYRYTPYQPNSAALAAGYGTGNACSSYGNRNFYGYFTDWFGDPSIEAVNFVNLDNPRYFSTSDGAYKIDPLTNEKSTLASGLMLKFTTKAQTLQGWCFRTAYDTDVAANTCVPQEFIKEVELRYEAVPVLEQEKMILYNSHKVYIRGESEADLIPHSIKRRFTKTVTFNNNTYYITEYDALNMNAELGIPVSSIVNFEDVDEYYTIPAGSSKINLETMELVDTIKEPIMRHFVKKIAWKGKIYYQTEYDALASSVLFISEESLQKTYLFINFEEPRNLCIKKSTIKIDPLSQKTSGENILPGQSIEFSTKILLNNTWYYRTLYDTQNNSNYTIPASDLEECK